MSNTKDNYCFESSSSNETKQMNAAKNLKLFPDNSEVYGTSVLNKSSFSGIFPSNGYNISVCQPNVNSQINQFFKIPVSDNLPVKQAKVKNAKNPSRKVQTGGIKSDLKNSPKKLSLIPRPSFINSSKSLHCSRSTQLNARKELIKKMVFLAECTLKENQVNHFTPVNKTLAGLTPKKTPRSGGYFMLPEFNKKVPKLEEIKSPIEDLIKKEMFSYCTKLLNDSKICDSNLKNKEEFTINTPGLPETKIRLNQVLYHCKLYSKEVTIVHEKIKKLDEAFESKLNQIPEYKIYNEFCVYQLKKEDLYRSLRIIDEEIKNSINSEMNVSNKLKTLMKKKGELFEKEKGFLKNFEEVVQITLEKFNDIETKEINTEGKINETPKLTKALRLSKKHETTPMTKKLKKLDSKSRGIQKNARI